MASKVISFKNVTKNYGTSRGIDNVSFDVERGEVYGFLGPNGAGKTTSISMMMDLIRPTSGSIKIFGFDSVKDSLKIKRRIGFLTDDMALDKGFSGKQIVEFFGNLRGGYQTKRVNELAKRLECNLDRKFKTLSRGNRQKVGLIAALMHDPELLILDEPTSGLDPIIQNEFNKIILERKKTGKTTFISSHILSEVQEICDRVAFIKDGKVMDVRNLSEMFKNLPRQIKIQSTDKNLPVLLNKLSGIDSLQDNKGKIICTFTGSIDSLVKQLSKYKINDLSIQDTDLEAIFMNYYGDKNA